MELNYFHPLHTGVYSALIVLKMKKINLPLSYYLSAAPVTLYAYPTPWIHSLLTVCFSGDNGISFSLSRLEVSNPLPLLPHTSDSRLRCVWTITLHLLRDSCRKITMAEFERY